MPPAPAIADLMVNRWGFLTVRGLAKCLVLTGCLREIG
jgi:hypothetical protein